MTGARSLALFAVLSCAGCGGPRARIAEATAAGDVETALARYDELAAHDGDDLEMLARIGLAVLEREARSDVVEVRRDAIRELAGAGSLGTPALERLSTRGGATGTAALLALARRGHEGSLRVLRGMAGDAEADVRAASVLALDPNEDRASIEALAIEPSPQVRSAAVLRLGALGPDDGPALALLEERARVDPEASVRASAVRALGSYEAAAIPSLRDRLSDPDPTVRLAALEALVRADREGARATIAALLAMPPATESIEAARMLASSPGGGAERPTDDDRSIALAYLRQALGAHDATLRAQAGIALAGLPARDDLLPPLLEALGRETDATAALGLARAILRREDDAPAAIERLRTISASDPGIVGLGAASELAAAGEEDGRDALRRHAAGGDPELRRLAVRALARDAERPFEVRPALTDADPRVRVAAAGGIVASEAAR